MPALCLSAELSFHSDYSRAMARRPDPERIYLAKRAGHLARLEAQSHLSPEKAEGGDRDRGGAPQCQDHATTGGGAKT